MHAYIHAYIKLKLTSHSIRTAMALDEFHGRNGRASTDRLNTNGTDSRHCTERRKRQSQQLNLDTVLTHHSTVPGFFCFGSWRWKLKRFIYRKIRWPYLGVKRKKWNKVRTEPLLHCIWPKKIKLKKGEKQKRTKMAKDNYLSLYCLRYPSFLPVKLSS